MPLINSVVLVSSSFVAYFAERYLHKGNPVWLLTQFRSYIEWSELSFKYLFITGVLLMGLITTTKARWALLR